jgi:hypothetical protein
MNTSLISGNQPLAQEYQVWVHQGVRRLVTSLFNNLQVDRNQVQALFVSIHAAAEAKSTYPKKREERMMAEHQAAHARFEKCITDTGTLICEAIRDVRTRLAAREAYKLQVDLDKKAAQDKLELKTQYQQTKATRRREDRALSLKYEAEKRGMGLSACDDMPPLEAPAPTAPARICAPSSFALAAIAAVAQPRPPRVKEEAVEATSAELALELRRADRALKAEAKKVDACSIDLCDEDMSAAFGDLRISGTTR